MTSNDNLYKALDQLAWAWLEHREASQEAETESPLLQALRAVGRTTAQVSVGKITSQATGIPQPLPEPKEEDDVPNPPEDRWVPLHQIAREINVDSSSFYGWFRNGLLHPKKVYGTRFLDPNEVRTLRILANSKPKHYKTMARWIGSELRRIRGTK